MKKILTLGILLIGTIALAGCSLGVSPEGNRECLTTTKPWVEIISPNGGETVTMTPQAVNPNGLEQQALGTIPVKIKVCNVTSSGWLRIGLLNADNKIALPIVFSYADFLSKQSLPMAVPAVGQYPVEVPDVGQYKVLVDLIDANAYVVTNTPADSDTSDDSFTIIRQNSTACLPTTAPWIEIIYPNGGEIYTMGQNIIIKWMTCNAQSGQTVSLGIGQEDAGNIGAFSPFKSFYPYRTINDGTEMVKLDASLMSGAWPFSSGNNYKVSAILNPLSTNTGEAPQIQDLSNNPFTIR